MITNIIANIRKNAKFMKESVEEIIDIIIDVLDAYSKEDQSFVEQYEKIDISADEEFDKCNNCSDREYCMDIENDEVPKEDPRSQDEPVEQLRMEPVCISMYHNVYGHTYELERDMPVELSNIFKIEGGKIYFGKRRSYNSFVDMFNDRYALSKYIRPSRGNLSAPQFRQLVEQWMETIRGQASSQNVYF